MDEATKVELLDIREQRFRLQQQIKALQSSDGDVDTARVEELEARIQELRDSCPCPRDEHGVPNPFHYEEDAGKGLWRCRDCDVGGEIEGIEQPQAEAGD